MEIKKGMELRITKAMSDDDNCFYEGYISRVFKEKCFFEFRRSNNRIAMSGRMTFYIKGIKNKLENGEATLL